MTEELFPIMVPRYSSELPGFLKDLREAGVTALVVGIPWGIIAPHEAQARANHGGQSLRQLADRGGLAPAEALAVLVDEPFAIMRSDEQTEAYRQLYDIVRAEGIIWQSGPASKVSA